MSRERITISLQTDIPNHRLVYEAFMRIPPGSRSEYAIDLIKAGLDQEQTYKTMLRALNDYQPQFKGESEAGQIPQDMLDFVFSL